jgi:hypothetical protein
MSNTTDLLQILSTVKGARFANFTYTSKGTGERSKYRVNLGVDVEKVYRDDLQTLNTLLPTLEGIDLEAATELKKSIETSLDVGIGNNPDYTAAGAYTSFPDIHGVKVHNETGDIHILCMVEDKEVIESGTYKFVNSRPKTIAKKKIEKNLRRSKIRQFVIPNLSRVALQGEVLTFG